MKQPHHLMAAATIAATGALAGQAHAEMWKPFNYDGAYVRAEGGWHNTDDHSYATGAGPTSVKYDQGYMAGAAIGVQNGAMRYELEGMHNRSGIKNLNVSGVNAPNIDGNTELNAAMANVYYDFGSARLKPYVGGGAGVGRLGVNHHSTAGTVLMDDEDTVFAYQGMAGLKYDLNPCWSVNAEYRYIGTNDAELTAANGSRSKVAYDSNNVIVGLSYKF